MANVEKIDMKHIFGLIRHNERLVQNPTNADIDKSKLNDNYFLSPDRGITSYDYFLKRKSECYLYGRDDVKVAFSWIVSLPQDVIKGHEDLFFYNVYDFLCERYGEENVISCTVHKDETTPHLHFLALPIVNDPKRGGEKFCMKDVLTRRELRNFHPDLQRYLKNNGVSGTVMSGITKRQGGNRTVAELKANGNKDIAKTRSRWRDRDVEM